MDYLKDENNLIVWFVLRPEIETELGTSYLGMRARQDMTTKELFYQILDTYKADKEKNYRFVLKRAAGDIELSLDQTVRDAGMRNGDCLQVIAAA
ncbi:EsaB/YukD family protein [Niallia oryzisoli]|uniref:EsaB/YukD family protein n=1 Tax=Niallia oryzisoli TaxID=1737571 RepID=UPI0037363040